VGAENVLYAGAASAANTTFEQNVALVNIYTTWYEITAFAGTTKSIFF
jgi:hypothetical protein